MNETVHIENVVLGGGEAGKYLAWDLAQQGRPVVVIERALIGGSCPNIACLPSKNVIRSAKVADLVSRAASYGVRIDGATVDMTGVRQRKREMVDGMIAIHRKKFAVPHLEFLLAEGILVGPRTVEASLPDGGSTPLRRRAPVPESRHAGHDPGRCRVLPTLGRSPMSKRSNSTGSRRT